MGRTAHKKNYRPLNMRLKTIEFRVEMIKQSIFSSSQQSINALSCIVDDWIRVIFAHGRIECRFNRDE